MSWPQQPPHRKPLPSQGRGLRPLEGGKEWGLEREFPAGQTGASLESGHSAELLGLLGAVDTLENSPCQERPHELFLAVDSMGVEGDMGLHAHLCPRAGLWDLTESSSQRRRRLQQPRAAPSRGKSSSGGDGNLLGTCGHSWCSNSASQPCLPGSLSGSRRHRGGADVFPPDVISNSNFTELRRENVSEAAPPVTSHPSVWVGTSSLSFLGRKEQHAGDVQCWLLYFNFLFPVMLLECLLGSPSD